MRHFAKGGALRLPLALVMLLCSAPALSAQRLSSYGVGIGAALQEDARATVAFAVSAGVQWYVPWLTILQRSLAELDTDSAGGTVHDVSLALLPLWQPLHGRVALGVGASLHDVRRDFALVQVCLPFGVDRFLDDEDVVVFRQARHQVLGTLKDEVPAQMAKHDKGRHVLFLSPSRRSR